MFGFLLRFARQVVAGVMSQLTQQMNIVQQQAYRPMQMMVQQVTGGVWIGKGADAFVQEVQSMMMPNTNTIIQTITKTHRDIQRAIDVIDRADRQVQQKVNGLADLFNSIF
ncbi:MAG: hypothetical protein KDE53_23565 [Caldilineaceae bacterium]|nr:hypothetical protein [Caldilineaceae bacterium]MCB0123701.1 hypothetical protein [Caldilineaceae bacterium]HRW06765.1 hypothetical protein [Caldilineaceae bacterium]